MHHFITQPTVQGDRLTVSEARVVHQMRRVLRLRPGDQCVIQWQGVRYVCEIVRYTDGSLDLIIIQTIPQSCQSLIQTSLVIALPHQLSILELIVQKGTEIGLDRMVCFVSQRSQSRDLSDAKLQRLQTIALEAAEQSHRWIVPEIQYVSWSEVLSLEGKKILCSLDGSSDRGQSLSRSEESMILYVGPEGGWNEQEEEELIGQGAQRISLGQNVLRMETAAIVGARWLTQQVR